MKRKILLSTTLLVVFVLYCCVDFVFLQTSKHTVSQYATYEDTNTKSISDINFHVAKFVEQYDTDWNYTVPNGTDPLDIAADWVNPQSLYPDRPLELGEYG